MDSECHIGFFKKDFDSPDQEVKPDDEEIEDIDLENIDMEDLDEQEAVEAALLESQKVDQASNKIA